MCMSEATILTGLMLLRDKSLMRGNLKLVGIYPIFSLAAIFSLNCLSSSSIRGLIYLLSSSITKFLVQ